MKNRNDDTKQKESISLAMKDMQKSRDKMKQAQLLAGIGSFEYLPDDGVIILSDEACVCLGLPEGENLLEIDTFCKSIRQGQHNKFCTMLKGEDGALGGAPVEFTFRDAEKNDRHIEVLLDGSSRTIEGSISGVFRDISRIKKAEIGRSVNAQAFETVFYNSKIAILVLNLKGYIIDYNDSALELTGYTPDEMIKMHSVGLLNPEDVSEASRIFARFINSAGKVNSLDYRIKDKAGEVIDVLVNFEMIIGAEGEKIYVFLNDIRNIKEMERKTLDQERMLIQQSKMATLGEMVALIAHQWQQPLNSIAMIVQMLDELIEVDDKNRQMLVKSIDSVMAQTTFMSNTMEDFRNFLKPAAQQGDFKIHDVLQDVVKLYRPQLRHYDITCEIFCETEDVKQIMVNGYENELKNVVLNFLTNSRDAIEQQQGLKGDIQIVLSQSKEYVNICIEDNGGGIAEEVMKRIFDPYVSSKGDKGTGLGLYMAKLIIKDRMKGKIKLANTDRGLKICIMLKKV